MIFLYDHGHLWLWDREKGVCWKNRAPWVLGRKFASSWSYIPGTILQKQAPIAEEWTLPAFFSYQLKVGFRLTIMTLFKSPTLSWPLGWSGGDSGTPIESMFKFLDAFPKREPAQWLSLAEMSLRLLPTYPLLHIPCQPAAKYSWQNLLTTPGCWAFLRHCVSWDEPAFSQSLWCFSLENHSRNVSLK